MKASESCPEESIPGGQRASGGRGPLVPWPGPASGPEIVVHLIARNDALVRQVEELREENRYLRGAASALQRN